MLALIDAALVVDPHISCYAAAMILAFDGVCVLCNGFVRFLVRHDRGKRLSFASSASSAGAAMFSASGQDPKFPMTVVLNDGNNTYLESDAIICAAMALGGGWRLIGIARALPKRWRDAGYRLVARRRYGWFGRLDHCPLPDASISERFLT